MNSYLIQTMDDYYTKEYFQEIETDVATGDYFVRIPEEIISELNLYENTLMKIVLDGNTIILAEDF